MAEPVAHAQQIRNDVLEVLSLCMPDAQVAVLAEFIYQYLLDLSDDDSCEFRAADLFGACVAH